MFFIHFDSKLCFLRMIWSVLPYLLVHAIGYKIFRASPDGTTPLTWLKSTTVSTWGRHTTNLRKNVNGNARLKRLLNTMKRAKLMFLRCHECFSIVRICSKNMFLERMTLPSDNGGHSTRTVRNPLITNIIYYIKLNKCAWVTSRSQFQLWPYKLGRWFAERRKSHRPGLWVFIPGSGFLHRLRNRKITIRSYLFDEFCIFKL